MTWIKENPLEAACWLILTAGSGVACYFTVRHR
jgi:hypothetical protein